MANRSKHWLWSAALLPLLALPWLLDGRAPAAAGATDGTGRPEPAAPRLPATAPTVPDSDPAHERQPSPSPGAAAATAATFAERIEQLVAIGVATSMHVAAGRLEEARTSDEAARHTLEQLLLQCPDPDVAALAWLCGSDPPADVAPITERIRRRVLHLVLAAGLQQRAATAAANGDRRPLDALVTALLTELPASPPRADELARQHLIDQPHLGSAHEDQVLELLAMAGEGRFAVELATALLSTLWQNLERSGSRTSEDLAALALLFLGEANPGKRATACRQLIGDARYRGIVLDHLRRSGDPALAREVAMAAARDLEPAVALDVLAFTAPLAPDFTSPFLALGMRAPAEVQTAYERQLGQGSDPALREQLVAGLGFAHPQLGMQTAQLALQSDPSPLVRLRAVFVLSGAATEAIGEEAFRRALADPELRRDPRHVGALVLALENFAHANHPNAVERLGRELLAVAPLDPAQRADLERILARALPPGGR